MSGLTEDERAVLIGEVLSRATGDGITTPLLAAGILRAVEQIITARLDEYKARAVAAIEWEIRPPHLGEFFTDQGERSGLNIAARIIRDLT